MDRSVAGPEAKHLCVLIHGLWGTPDHLTNVAKALRDKHPEESLYILIAKRNSGSFSYDGIELGGERVCQEIEEELEKLAREGRKIRKLSIVGYSLGGLVARYAVGLLYSRGIFDELEPVNFTTFATPHLGVRTPLRGWHNHIWNILGARAFSMSGRQLFAIDNFRETGRPLFSVLADPNSIFIRGLALFKRRTLYANIINDRISVYYTTSISKIDPFTDLDKVKINYAKGYEDVVLDPSEPVAPPEPPTSDLPPFFSRLTAIGQALVNRTALTLALVIIIPIGAVAVLVNSALQTTWSSRRIRLHESGKAGIEVGTYRMPLLISGMKEAVEEAYENLNSAQENEYLSSGGEEALGNKIPSSPQRERPESPIASRSVPEVGTSEKLASSLSPIPSADTITTLDDAIRPQSRHLDVPTLALTPDQLAMIQALDNIGWRKYPVHIHKVWHSHAAMIVRSNKSGLVEGYTVLRHWLEEEFLID